MRVVAAAATEEAAPVATSTGGGSSKWVIDPNEQLSSTDEHRLWTYGPMAVMIGTYALAWAHASSDAQAAGGSFFDCISAAFPLLFATASAYVLSDLGTAVYHWFVDNYGDAQTPIFGRQIAAFQGHHQRPWTITQRQFANNLHQVFKPAFYPAALIALLALLRAEPGGNAGEAFCSSFLLLVCFSQQTHAWSHMKRSELHPAVLFLQEKGVLIGRKAHGAHHKPNFEGNYAIVSGIWNKPLDESGFFRKLEQVVKAVTGVEPRCWHPPEYGWAEEARPAGMTMSSDLDE